MKLTAQQAKKAAEVLSKFPMGLNAELDPKTMALMNDLSPEQLEALAREGIAKDVLMNTIGCGDNPKSGNPRINIVALAQLAASFRDGSKEHS